MSDGRFYVRFCNYMYNVLAVIALYMNAKGAAAAADERLPGQSTRIGDADRDER